MIRSIIQRFSDNGLNMPMCHAEVEEFCSSNQLTPYEFCNFFAHQVINDFSSDQLSYTDADMAMNSLDAYILAQYNVGLPAYAREVYEAFDEGEYIHRGDDKSVDPVKKYTWPRVQGIMANDKELDNPLNRSRK